jgi:hypothetical protein
MPHDEDARGIASVPGDVLVDPAQGLGDVPNQDLHLHVGQQPVVCRYKHEAALGEHTGLDLDVGLVPRLPAAAVNPEDDGQILRLLGRVDVEDLALLGSVHVRDVGLEMLCLRGGGKQEEHDCGFHGECPRRSHWTNRCDQRCLTKDGRSCTPTIRFILPVRIGSTYPAVRSFSGCGCCQRSNR